MSMRRSTRCPQHFLPVASIRTRRHRAFSYRALVAAATLAWRLSCLLRALVMHTALAARCPYHRPSRSRRAPLAVFRRQSSGRIQNATGSIRNAIVGSAIGMRAVEASQRASLFKSCHRSLPPHVLCMPAVEPFTDVCTGHVSPDGLQAPLLQKPHLLPTATHIVWKHSLSCVPLCMDCMRTRHILVALRSRDRSLAIDLGSGGFGTNPPERQCHYDPTSTWYYSDPPGYKKGAVPSPLQPLEWQVTASPVCCLSVCK